MSVVLFGNTNAVDPGARQPVGSQVTSVNLPDSYTMREKVLTITDREQGVWAAHSLDPVPAWVESADLQLAVALSAVYGCPIGRPVTEEGESNES